MKYEIATVFLDKTKNAKHPSNAPRLAMLKSYAMRGWEVLTHVPIGDEVLVVLRLKKRFHWKFWRKPEPPEGKKSYAVRMR
jgi:hypothetical protein